MLAMNDACSLLLELAAIVVSRRMFRDRANTARILNTDEGLAKATEILKTRYCTVVLNHRFFINHADLRQQHAV
jgi:hypothetical protein